MTTKQTETLSGAMALAFAEIEAATKAANNPHFKSKYADLSSVIDAIKPALVNHGLFFTQHCHPSEDGVIVETVLGHSCGDEKSLGKLFVPAKNKDAHGFGSALTYARRYSLMTAFGVPAEDDDGNAASKVAPTNGRAANANTAKPISDDQRDTIQALAVPAGKSLQEICAAYRVESLKGLTETQAAKLIERLRADAAPEKETVNA